MRLENGAVTLVFAAMIATACATGGFRAGRPFQKGEARFFDDGVDMIDDLSRLSGEWGFQAKEELDGRVQLADLIAEVNVLALQTVRDVDGREAIRIEVEVVDALLGNAPDAILSLSSPVSSPGHQLVLRHMRRLTGRYILFARWFEAKPGALDHHFHLSPATLPIKSAVRKRIDERIRREQEVGSR